MTGFIVEYCSECEHENEFRWDVDEFGYKAYCPHCGAVLMLCDECSHREDQPPKCIDITIPAFECARTENSVHAADVIRCKDCKHLRIDKDFQSGRYCAIRNVNGGGFCKDNDFCSYGERKE